MAKRKHTTEWMLARVMEYLNGEGSYHSISKAYGIGYETLRRWVSAYEAQGETAFIQPSGNKSYSKEFKIKCIKTVLRGELSIPDCVATHGISNDSILRHWISEYNATEARRKTTIEERKEIVKYCIEHGRDYKGTASLYDVSYTQVYSWVRKYVADGEDALIDKRGHHKTDDEVDELERLRRENTRLKRQLEEKDMLVTLLKKVKELEGM